MHRLPGMRMTIWFKDGSRQHKPPVSAFASLSEKRPSPFFCCCTCSNTKLNRKIPFWYYIKNLLCWLKSELLDINYPLAIPLLKNLFACLPSLLLLRLLQSSLRLFHPAWECFIPAFSDHSHKPHAPAFFAESIWPMTFCKSLEKLTKKTFQSIQSLFKFQFSVFDLIWFGGFWN